MGGAFGRERLKAPLPFLGRPSLSLRRGPRQPRGHVRLPDPAPARPAQGAAAALATAHQQSGAHRARKHPGAAQLLRVLPDGVAAHRFRAPVVELAPRLGLLGIGAGGAPHRRHARHRHLHPPAQLQIATFECDVPGMGVDVVSVGQVHQRIQRNDAGRARRGQDARARAERVVPAPVGKALEASG